MGESNMTGDDYISWLQQKSMLADASTIAGQFSGTGDVWQHPFAVPNPAAAIRKASIWFTAYPISMITKPGHSFLSTLADDDLWAAFEAIGINAVHTGPVKRAGALLARRRPQCGWSFRPDKHADRRDVWDRRGISPTVPSGGRTWWDRHRRHCPGHTGKGADFRLAEMNVGDYPGIYHMVEIPPEDWHLLPEVLPARIRSTSIARPRTSWRRPDTLSAGCSG